MSKQINDSYEATAKQIAKLLGFRGVQPYSKLWGTTNAVFGRRDASMWLLRFDTRKKDGTINRVEVNTTYFKYLLPKTKKINALLRKRVAVDEIALMLK
jgi:hypothetical protein